MPDPASGRSDPDVLIIGGGVAGLFCAHFLRLAGLSVVVAERGTIGGPGSCSHGNVGFVGTQGSAPLAGPGMLARGLRGLADPRHPFSIRPRPDPELLSWLWHFRRACNARAAATAFGLLLDLKQRSLALLTGLRAAGHFAGSFTAPGILLACRTPAGFAETCRSVPAAVAGGVPLRVLEPGELAELEPGTDFDIAGALINAEGAAVDAPAFVADLAALVTAEGADLRPAAEVTGFEVRGGRIGRVLTSRGDFTPGEVVVAAGAWSAACARQLGVGLALQPARGYAVTVAAPAGALRRPVALIEGKVSVLPSGDCLRLGGIIELAGMGGGVSAGRVASIRRIAAASLPGLAAAPTVATWRGFRPCTPDSLPHLGRAPRYANLSVATGGGSIGMGLAPACGELLAQVITGQPPRTDPAPFRPGRFGPRRERTP